MENKQEKKYESKTRENWRLKSLDFELYTTVTLVISIPTYYFVIKPFYEILKTDEGRKMMLDTLECISKSMF